MSKRSAILLLFVLLILGAVLGLPAVHWRLIGWARSESFCRGRPASYWKPEVRALGEAIRELEDAMLGRPPQPSFRSAWYSAQDRVLGFFLGSQADELDCADPAAIRVLEELKADRDPDVREGARLLHMIQRWRAKSRY